MFKILDPTPKRVLPERTDANKHPFGKTITVLEKGLDAASLRQEVIANNIANVNTPGFKRSDVTFEMELRQALGRDVKKLEAKRTHPDHIHFSETDLSKVKARIVTEGDTIFRNDLNNVDLDHEMTELTKNSLMYEAMVTRISSIFDTLRRVIASR